jgi:hypothetical protein
MSEIEYPSELIAAQKAADAAWAAVEAHRKQVDADRRATATPPGERHERPVMRPWAPEEDARHEELMAAVREAQEAVAAGIAAAGLSPTYDVVQGLKRAAKGGAA